ncbi:hypothetical protein GCM10022229_25670 [Luteimonas lutimaris]|uniref:PA2169 family four-helix-bundle protein n=2 Tax=Luteimonas lutimaris TaxID=698645 RepID=A0ABP7MVK3_9GAMM
MLLGLAGCGGAGHDATGAAAAERMETVAPAPAGAAATDVAASEEDANPASQPLHAGDVDAYARGMAREIELLQAGYDRFVQAGEQHDEDAQMTALMELSSPDVDAAGAKAAGLDVARYGFVKNAIDTVLGKLDLKQGLEGSEGSGDLLAQLGDPYAGLADEVRAAMETHRQELARLRADALGIRMKAAGS